jgi:peptide/nickel transport system substrate-binding protein
VRRLNKAVLDHVVYAPLGSCLRLFAWRKGVTGVVQGPLPLFWGVGKSA